MWSCWRRLSGWRTRRRWIAREPWDGILDQACATIATVAFKVTEIEELEPDVRTERQRQEPVTFRDVVGQQEVLSLLRLEIAASRREGRRLADVLFVGASGLGKTLLMTATANEAGCAVYPVTGPELSTTDSALQTLAGCGCFYEATGRPVALAIDVAEIAGAVEPFLLRAQLSQVMRSGRRLTEKGKAYLSGLTHLP